MTEEAIWECIGELQSIVDMQAKCITELTKKVTAMERLLAGGDKS